MRHRSGPSHYPDVGRRVAQCRCDHAVAWRGDDEMRLLGWTSAWRPGLGGALVRFWTCASCSAATATAAPSRLPRAPVLPPAYTVPEQLVEQAHRYPERAQELLERLFNFEAPRAEAFLVGILASFDRDSKAAKNWRAYARHRRARVTARAKAA